MDGDGKRGMQHGHKESGARVAAVAVLRFDEHRARACAVVIGRRVIIVRPWTPWGRLLLSWRAPDLGRAHTPRHESSRVKQFQGKGGFGGGSVVVIKGMGDCGSGASRARGERGPGAGRWSMSEQAFSLLCCCRQRSLREQVAERRARSCGAP